MNICLLLAEHNLHYFSSILESSDARIVKKVKGNQKESILARGRSNSAKMGGAPPFLNSEYAPVVQWFWPSKWAELAFLWVYIYLISTRFSIKKPPFLASNVNNHWVIFCIFDTLICLPYTSTIFTKTNIGARENVQGLTTATPLLTYLSLYARYKFSLLIQLFLPFISLYVYSRIEERYYVCSAMHR